MSRTKVLWFPDARDHADGLFYCALPPQHLSSARPRAPSSRLRMGKKDKAGKVKKGREPLDTDEVLLDRRLPCGINIPSFVCAALFYWPCGGSLRSLSRIFSYGAMTNMITRLLIKKFNIGEKSYMFTFLVTYPWVLMVCILWFLGFRRIWLTWSEAGQLFLAALGMRMAGPPVLGSEEFEELITEALEETNGDVSAIPMSLRHSLPLQELRATYRNAAHARKGRQNERLLR